MGDWYKPWTWGTPDSQPPNYQGAAQQQAQGSQVNQQGVVGSSFWGTGPDGRSTQTQTLNGPLAGAANNYMGQIAGQGALDFSGLSPLDMGEQAGTDARNAAYGQATSRLDPMWGQRGEQLQGQLASQGLDPGSEAANNAQGDFSRARNDAYGSAQNASVLQGQQAQGQAFQRSLQGRQQQIAELLKQRGMPAEQLQQLLSMMGGAQGVGAAQGPNYLGAAQAQGQYALGANEQGNQFLSPLVGAGATALLSDEREKQDIERLPLEVMPGIPWALFRYKGRQTLHVGVIAQDVQKVAPECVQEYGGMLHVDYVALGRVAWA